MAYSDRRPTTGLSAPERQPLAACTPDQQRARDQTRATVRQCPLPPLSARAPELRNTSRTTFRTLLKWNRATPTPARDAAVTGLIA